MNLAALVAELKTAPYAGKTAQECYDLLTALSYSTYSPISAEKFRLWVVSVNALPTLTNVANENPAKSLAALLLLKFNQGEDLNLADADVRTALDSLVENNVFTAQQKNSLLAEGTVSISRATQLGLDGVTVQDVIDALYQISLTQGG